MVSSIPVGATTLRPAYPVLLSCMQRTIAIIFISIIPPQFKERPTFGSTCVLVTEKANLAEIVATFANQIVK